MDDFALKRIITLIDMDCFYCQVELRLDPSLKGKPMAVVQYNQWKQGGIIAVNYEARDRGVTRFMRGEEAKKICPELCLPSVPCVRGKADLTRYRDAGQEVADVFTSFSGCVSRASVDEAFIDLTSLVEERIRSGNVNLSPENLPSTFVVGHSCLSNNDMGDRLKGTTTWLKILKNNDDPCSPDYRLAVGAMIVEEIRSEVLKKTGFHCSAGIGHNKILAKLVAGLHKPKCQTIIPHENVPELYETMPFKKVRNLGGKFGKQVAQKLSISYMSELYNFSKEELIEKFNAKNGSWLFDIARGIDHEPVTLHLIPDSIGCSKNFPGPAAISSKDKLIHWLRDMATEVVVRLEKDQMENTRRATQLVVSFKQGGSSGSRSCPLSAYKADVIAKDALDVLAKFNQTIRNGSVWEPPIEFLGLSTGKFTCEKTTIKNFLKEKPTIKEENISLSHSKESNCTESCENNESVEKIEPPNATISKKSGIISYWKEVVPVTSAREIKFTQKGEKGKKDKPKRLLRSSIESFTVESLAPQEKKPATVTKTDVDEMRADSLLIEEQSLKVEGERSNINSEVLEAQPIKSFFVQIMAQKISEESKPANPSTTTTPAPEPEPSTSFANRHEIPEISAEDEWTQVCPECLEKVHLSEFLEHMDYHTAMKLDRDLNGRIQVKTVTIPKQNKGSPVRKKRKLVRPVDQKEITTFFSCIPK